MLTTENEKDMAPVQEENQQLTINDLVAMKSIIDVASQRGAFKPNEMVVIGQTYNKINLFLEAIKKQSGESK